MFGGRNFEQATCMLSKQDINYDTSLTVVFDSSNPRDLRYEVYDVSGTVKRRGGKVKFQLLGVTSSLDTILSKPEPRTQDLSDIELRAAVSTLNLHQPHPFIEKLNSVEKPKSYSATTHSYMLVKLLQRKLNFKLKLILTDDWRFDLIGHNSSRGIVGQLQTTSADFAITPFGLTTERLPMFDSTIEIARGTFYTVFRHPKSLNESNIFLLPFETLLWACIVLTFTVVAIILGFAAVCNRQKTGRSYTELLVEQSLLGTLGMLCQQGFNLSTGVCSNRILTLVTMCFSLLLVQFYSSFIVGYQLISPPKTITTLEKLLHSNLKMSVENLSYQLDFFQRTRVPVAMQLYERKILPNKYGFVNLTFGIQLVKQGGYAFHCETSYGNELIIETFTEQQICELQQLQLYPQRSVHLPMIKGSPLRELFKINLQLLKETGLLAYYHSRNYIPRPKCNKKSNTAEQVYLADVRFAFLLLAAGMAASVLVLLWELILAQVRRWYDRKTLSIPRDFVWLN
ncbi:ionotropic receptor 75a-like [Anopheles nili]|uniref:ionotropic receptor 75a-like n=1 Tax=Anopheles nili TaxID=185578 RepID=UPI00237C5040|nr:ionotropic receptor 75a-like [Anopheles nili]